MKMIMTSQHVSLGSETIVIQASFKFSNVDTNTVMKKLRKLNLKKATGYDGLSIKLIKFAAPKLLTSLTRMYK